MKDDYDEKRKFVSMVKITVTFFLALAMVIATIIGAMAYTIDADDELYLERGDVVEGTFVIENFEVGSIFKSNMEWISLQEDKYVSEKVLTGTKLIDSTYVFSYWVNIPENADIGIYRSTIEVQAPSGTKYLNVKMSVQNKLVTSISKVMHRPSSRIPVIVAFAIVLMLLFILAFRRAKNGSKR